MSNNANGNNFFPVWLGTMVIIILSYKTFGFIGHSDVCARLVVPDTDSRVTCSTDTDSRVTCSTDTDSRMTCSKK